MKKLIVFLIVLLPFFVMAQTYQRPAIQGNKEYSGYQKFNQRINVNKGLVVGAGQVQLDSITKQNNKLRFKKGSSLIDPLISDTVSIITITVIPLIYQANGDTTGVSASKPGDIFIDKTNKKFYFSWASGRGKWVIAN
jgi:hypothetical protein